MAESEAAPAAGARTLGEESAEVKAIGALLRGEKKPTGERVERPAPGGAGDGAAAVAVDAGGVEAELQAEAGGEEDGGVGPLTMGELAKSLGVKEGELFEELRVEVELTRADGTKGREELSLGDLRRSYVAGEKLEREREVFEAEADKRSLEFMQARAELERLGELVIPNASREVVEKFQGVLLQREARERALLLEAVPEWKDAARFAADRASMIEFLKPWGFSAPDVYAIADHRIARFVRDMARDHKRKAEAERRARERGNGELKKSQAPDGRVSVSPLRARLANIVKAGKAATTPQAKTEAIGALLRSTQRGK